MAQGAKLPSLATIPVGYIHPERVAQANFLTSQLMRVLSNYTAYGPVVYLSQFQEVSEIVEQAVIRQNLVSPFPAAPPATSPRVFPADFYAPRWEHIPAVTWPPQGR